MTKDLANPGAEKPLWPLTSYAPTKYVPVLIGGIDESFEELRVRAVMALQSGTISTYVRFFFSFSLQILLNTSITSTDKI